MLAPNDTLAISRMSTPYSQLSPWMKNIRHVASAPTKAKPPSSSRLRSVRSAIAPTSGSTRTCSSTEIPAANAKTLVARMSMPRNCTKPAGFAALWATSVRYGPRNRVMTVVENVEFAKS